LLLCIAFNDLLNLVSLDFAFLITLSLENKPTAKHLLIIRHLISL
jgi:hypothetical protein